MGDLWFIWIIGFLILMTIAAIVQRRFRKEARRSAAEEELERLRERIALAEDKLASLTEGEEAYWDTQEELNDCVELDVVTHTAGLIDAER